MVKVLLSREQKEILDLLAKMLGISASEAMRTAFMEYAKSLNLVKQKIGSARDRAKRSKYLTIFPT